MHYFAITVGAFAVLWALLMVVLLYIVAPLKMWGEPMKADPGHVEILLDELPEHAQESLTSIAKPLLDLGFKPAIHTRALNMLANSEAYQSIWLLNSPGVIALCFVTRNTSGPWPITHFTTTLKTNFADDSSIITSNMKVIGVFARNTKNDYVRWGGMSDIATLLDLHLKRLKILQGARRIVMPSMNEMESFNLREHQRTMDFQVSRGFFWHDEPNYVYRKTLVGTFIMTYRLLPPLKQIRRLRDTLRLRSALRSVGMNVGR